MQPRSNRRREAGRAIVTAELLAIGTELTVGETTDTNSGELARSLVGPGRADRPDLEPPDDLAAVVDALRTALGRADLVVTTGGLGPTPDDLTREAVAEAVRRDAGRRRGDARVAARAVGAPPPAVPGDQPQAGLGAPVGRDAARTRTAPRPAGGSTGPTAGSSSRCPGRRARCGRCGRTRSVPRLAARGVGPGERGPDAAPDRHRRVAGRGAARRAAAAGDQPDRRDLRAPGGGRRPDLRACRGRRPAAEPRRRCRGGRARRARGVRLGDRRHHLGGRAWPTRWPRAAGRWRRSRAGPTARSSRCCRASRRSGGPRSAAGESTTADEGRGR